MSNKNFYEGEVGILLGDKIILRVTKLDSWTTERPMFDSRPGVRGLGIYYEVRIVLPNGRELELDVPTHLLVRFFKSLLTEDTTEVQEALRQHGEQHGFKDLHWGDAERLSEPGDSLMSDDIVYEAIFVPIDPIG